MDGESQGALSRAKTLDMLRALAYQAVNSGDDVTLANIMADDSELIRSDAAISNRIGTYYLRCDRPRDAMPFLRAALELEPEGGTHWRNLSAALALLGQGDEAVAAFTRSVWPWNADCIDGGRNLRLEYEGLAIGYDDNSRHQYFSKHLVSFYASVTVARRLGSVLELGCGTGLLAMNLPASFRALCGIDLSPQMLQRAKERKLYDRLIEGDLSQAMAELDDAFDTVFSSCVLCYVADLEPVFRHVARLLRPGGLFLFSVDPVDDAMEICVSAPGEYCHSRRYLRAQAAGVGLVERAIEVAPHRGPPGFWCAFAKPA